MESQNQFESIPQNDNNIIMVITFSIIENDKITMSQIKFQQMMLCNTEYLIR